MARNKSEGTQKMEKLLDYAEVVNAIEMGLGSKKGIEKAMLNPDGTFNKDSKEYKNRQRQILRGVFNLVEFMGMNPYEIVEKARQASQNPEVYRELQNELTKFMSWLIVSKGMSETTAKVYRGNALSIIKWNTGLMISLNHKVGSSNKKKRDQKLGIDNKNKLEILKLMFSQGDLEMRAFIALGMCSGWRPGDLSTKFHIETLMNWLNQERDYIILSYNDKKRGADIQCVLGPFQQKIVKQYLNTIDDNRQFLFGDSKGTQRRLSEKLETLLHQVYKGDDNVVTPHTMRSLVETNIVMAHNFNKSKAYAFTGHVEDGVYIQLTHNELLEVFKACEEDLSLGEYIPKSSDFVEVSKVVKILEGLVDNSGKMTHCYHEFNGMDTESRDALEAEKRLEMQCASFLFKQKEALYHEFRARLIAEIQEGTITL